MELNPSSSSFSTVEALELITPYLSSSETQVLRNAATALAAIGTVQSAALLADLAVLQGDPSVRRRAGEELAQLPTEAKRAAAERARDHLLASLEPRAGESLEPAGHANDLLVALRRQGVGVELPERPMPRWLEGLRKQLHPTWWAGLAPVWQALAFAISYHALFWKLRRHLVQTRPRRPFWWSVFCALLWALPGVGLTLFLFWLFEPDLAGHVYLGVGVPSALIAATLAALLHDTAVSSGSYCDVRLGALIEVEGLMRRPEGKWWRQLAFPLAVGGVAVLGLAPMLLGFNDLALKPFHYLVWLLLSTLFLLLLFMVMRAVAALGAALWGSKVSAVLGAVIGLAFGWGIPWLVFYCVPTAVIAILITEGAILLPALVTAVFGEHWQAGETPGRGPSRAVVWPLIATLVVILPGIWLGLKEEIPRAEKDAAPLRRQWHLAHVPVERTLQVDFPQKVRATFELETGPAQLELRLRHNNRIIEGTAITNGKEWNLEETGTYTLEVTVGKRRVTSNPLSFVVQESYATAVGLIARELLAEHKAKPPIPSTLVGAFTLELVLGGEVVERQERGIEGAGRAWPGEG